MDLSIVVVNWNTCGLLEQCLQAVYQMVQGIEFETLVVDNASTDGSAAMVRLRFPQARLIENRENAGFARANNQAVRASRGRSVLLLNSDAFLSEHTVARMMAALELDERTGVVGAALSYPDGQPQVSYGPLPTLRSEIISLLGLDKLTPASRRNGFPKAIETGTVIGACLLVRRAVLDQVGLLDEGFFMFSEEVDLCHRARQAGWKVVHVPGAQAVHVGGASTGATPERVVMLYRGKLQFFEKHFGPASRRRLLRAMRWISQGKGLVYTALGWISSQQVEKGKFWRAVAQRLSER